MKKIILLAAIALITSLSAFAQDACCDKQPCGYEMNFETAPFWSNWFISANVGAQSFISKDDKTADFGEYLSAKCLTHIGEYVFKEQHLEDLCIHSKTKVYRWYITTMDRSTEMLCLDC